MLAFRGFAPTVMVLSIELPVLTMSNDLFPCGVCWKPLMHRSRESMWSSVPPPGLAYLMVPLSVISL